MAKPTVQFDLFGQMKPLDVNGKHVREMAPLLADFPTAKPAAEVLQSALSTLPTAQGLVRLIQTRWARQTHVADHQPILDAMTRLFVDEASPDLKPAATAFFTSILQRIKDLIVQSVDKFGQTTGDVYDDVFGESTDKSTVPGYLPSVAHFQLYYHEIVNSKEVFKAWEDCLAGCGTQIASASGPGLVGSSAERRVFTYLLSLAQDISYLRLCAALLNGSVTFQYV